MPSPRTWTGLLAATAGVLSGVAGYTFHYGEGWSYFSRDPEACVNCHVMEPQFDSWSKGGHHAAAGCVDCHLPQSGIEKWVAKGDNGWRHSWAFTFEDFHEPIRITPRNARILQANCLRCHGDFVHELVAGSTTAADAVACVHCHAGVGHGARR
jgi:cytochrome c nitrite reductase small subunit